jgi:hypothetical protein
VLSSVLETESRQLSPLAPNSALVRDANLPPI